MTEGVLALLENIDYLLSTRGPFDKPGDVVGLHLRTSDWQEVAEALRAKQAHSACTSEGK